MEESLSAAIAEDVDTLATCTKALGRRFKMELETLRSRELAVEERERKVEIREQKVQDAEKLIADRERLIRQQGVHQASSVEFEQLKEENMRLKGALYDYEDLRDEFMLMQEETEERAVWEEKMRKRETQVIEREKALVTKTMFRTLALTDKAASPAPSPRPEVLSQEVRKAEQELAKLNASIQEKNKELKKLEEKATTSNNRTKEDLELWEARLDARQAKYEKLLKTIENQDKMLKIGIDQLNKDIKKHRHFLQDRIVKLNDTVHRERQAFADAVGEKINLLRSPTVYRFCELMPDPDVPGFVPIEDKQYQPSNPN